MVMLLHIQIKTFLCAKLACCLHKCGSEECFCWFNEFFRKHVWSSNIDWLLLS